MAERRSFTWQCRDRQLLLGEQTAVMGILNVTPDSFSDGGLHQTAERAIARAEEMIEQGAHILDVGGESTRPGAASVSVSEEINRVVPVIEQLAASSDVLISVDTTKSEVAEAALEAGAHIINDISAFTLDPDMVEIAMRYQAGAVLMHMQGLPQTMQVEPQYREVVTDVVAYLSVRVEDVISAGLAASSICIDPGIGFGKTVEHNVDLLAGLPAFSAIQTPVLVGLSRKSFLGKLTGCEVGDRLAGSLAGLVYSIMRGAHILRVHDVKESCEAARIADILSLKESMFE